MDNGEVIPGLNDDWTLGGAKLGEWVAGFMMFIVCSELFFENIARSMPQLLVIWVATTFTMAATRRTFPDEERGIRNAALTAVGIPPPGVPIPAALQPYWSGAPMREIPTECWFNRLRLHEVFEESEDTSSTANKSV